MSQNLLSTVTVESILASPPLLTVGVLGDLFLDRYLDLDGTLTEPSLETGLDAYQVVAVRSYPGAAGTVVNNLAGCWASAASGCSRSSAMMARGTNWDRRWPGCTASIAAVCSPGPAAARPPTPSRC
ncbi:MAG: hypothetical protein U0736_02230 [Gemmataceae bacterium]